MADTKQAAAEAMCEHCGHSRRNHLMGPCCAMLSTNSVCCCNRFTPRTQPARRRFTVSLAENPPTTPIKAAIQCVVLVVAYGAFHWMVNLGKRYMSGLKNSLRASLGWKGAGR